MGKPKYFSKERVRRILVVVTIDLIFEILSLLLIYCLHSHFYPIFSHSFNYFLLMKKWGVRHNKCLGSESTGLILKLT
jgi:hypothetical protein